MNTVAEARPATADLAAVKRRQQATWASGDYAVVGTTLQIVGETLAESVDVRAGEHGLDVFGHDAGMRMNQRPRLRGPHQRDRCAGREAGFELRRLARVAHDRLHVVEQGVGGMDARHHHLHQQQVLGRLGR